MSVKLDARLNALLEKISVNARVADIGCDHGKLAVCAYIKTGNPVVAVDISEKCLEKTKSLACAESARAGVKTRCANGLDGLTRSDADTVVIAGMGGWEIAEILESAQDTFDNYILLPHKHPQALKAYLHEKDFAVDSDEVRKFDGKFYRLMTVKPPCVQKIAPVKDGTKDSLSPSERVARLVASGLKTADGISLYCGNVQTDDFREYRKKRLERINELLEQAERGGGTASAELMREKAALEEK